MRPDRVYGTGVLTAIPGFQPVQNAMEVAQRFTAIWPPMVTDVPRAAMPQPMKTMAPSPTTSVATAATISPGNASIPGSTTVTTTTPAMHGAFGAAAPTLMQRFRIWAANRALKRALAKRGLKGFGAAASLNVRPAPVPGTYWNPHGIYASQGQVPVVGGYEPLTPTMAQLAFRIGTQSAGSVQSTPFPPVYQPSQAMAAQISAIAGQPAELSQQLVQQAIGGLVGQRASNQALDNFFALNNLQPWGA